jgi:hypothetical protein
MKQKLIPFLPGLKRKYGNILKTINFLRIPGIEKSIMMAEEFDLWDVILAQFQFLIMKVNEMVDGGKPLKKEGNVVYIHDHQVRGHENR